MEYQALKLKMKIKKITINIVTTIVLINLFKIKKNLFIY